MKRTQRQEAASARNWKLARIAQAVATLRSFPMSGRAAEELERIANEARRHVEKEWDRAKNPPLFLMASNPVVFRERWQRICSKYPASFLSTSDRAAWLTLKGIRPPFVVMAFDGDPFPDDLRRDIVQAGGTIQHAKCPIPAIRRPTD